MSLAAEPRGEAPSSLVEASELSGLSYLFGYPIAHSLSPLLHGTVYKALGLSRAQIPLPSRDIPELLALTKDPKFYGAAVTMPHKIAIIPHLDKLTTEATEVGAVNTIFVRHDSSGKRILCGTNTDVVGIREAFYRNVANKRVFRDRPGLVIGGGGAARSAVYAMQKYMGVGPIYLVNRDPSEVQGLISQLDGQHRSGEIIHVSSVAQASLLEAPGAVVSCIPDFTPTTDAERVARAIVETFLSNGSASEKEGRKGAVLEMCYHPNPWTQIAEITAKAGWQVILGTEAMIWQGLEQDRYWTGRPLDELPIAEVKAAVANALTKSML